MGARVACVLLDVALGLALFCLVIALRGFSVLTRHCSWCFQCRGLVQQCHGGVVYGSAQRSALSSGSRIRWCLCRLRRGFLSMCVAV